MNRDKIIKVEIVKPIKTIEEQYNLLGKGLVLIGIISLPFILFFGYIIYHSFAGIWFSIALILLGIIGIKRPKWLSPR